MKTFTSLLVGVATLAGLVGLIAAARGHADQGPATNFVTEIPHGYRNWQWISSAHEAGNLNSLGAILGNDVAMRAYRGGQLPFPDGTIRAALHYRYVPRTKTTKFLARSNRSFLALPQTSSSWSKTQKSTPQPAAGDSATFKTVNLATQRL